MHGKKICLQGGSGRHEVSARNWRHGTSTRDVAPALSTTSFNAETSASEFSMKMIWLTMSPGNRPSHGTLLASSKMPVWQGQEDPEPEERPPHGVQRHQRLAGVLFKALVSESHR